MHERFLIYTFTRKKSFCWDNDSHSFSAVEYYKLRRPPVCEQIESLSRLDTHLSNLLKIVPLKLRLLKVSLKQPGDLLRSTRQDLFQPFPVVNLLNFRYLFTRRAMLDGPSEWTYGNGRLENWENLLRFCPLKHHFWKKNGVLIASTLSHNLSPELQRQLRKSMMNKSWSFRPGCTRYEIIGSEPIFQFGLGPPLRLLWSLYTRSRRRVKNANTSQSISCSNSCVGEELCCSATGELLHRLY